MMKVFALLGHPVEHSLSPKLHNAVFEALDLKDYRYELCDTLPEQLAERMRQFKVGEYEGFSVTIPHKQAVIEFVDELSDRAKRVGAINTILRREDGKLLGENTDYGGFEKSLEELDVIASEARQSQSEGIASVSAFPRNDKLALVLGSGGAARAVIAVLLDHGFSVTVVSSRPDEEGELIERFGVELKGYEELDPGRDWSLIVNCTPVGMFPKVGVSVIEDSRWFRPHRVYCDVVYNPRITRFLELAQGVGAKTVTGDRMFLWQAVEQAKLFTGKEEVPLGVMEGLLKANNA
ncbi:MAG: shikimate dehydrogenase [bacterium]|nr:shikimate dehydrogenase [bacterium]